MDLGFMQRLRAKDPGAFRSEPEATTGAWLLHCLQTGEPVVVLTGAAGVGKTVLLGDTLLQLGSAEPRLLHLEPPYPSAAEVQRRLNGLLDPDGSHVLNSAEIAQSLLLLPAPTPGVSSVVVVLDAAETAPTAVLQYLWLMHSLTSLGRPALQLVLVGRETLWDRLAEAALSNLRRAVSAQLVLQPFSEAESQAYVAHLLRRRGRWIDPDASAAIVAGGGGLAGKLTALVDAACLAAERHNSAGARSISLSGVSAALGTPLDTPSDTRSSPEPVAEASQPARIPRRGGPPWRAGAIGLCAAAAIAIGGWEWRAATRPPPQHTPVRLVHAPAPPPAPPAVRTVRKPAAVVHTAAVRALPHLVAPPAARPISGSQAAFEAVALAQPPASLLDRWGWPALRPHVTSAAPATPARPVTQPAPLLVLADATAPKVTVLFVRGDARREARAWLVVKTLRQSGIEAADPVPVLRQAERPGIGYYFAADRDAAAAVARRLAGLMPAVRLDGLPMPTDPPPPGAIQVLLATR